VDQWQTIATAPADRDLELSVIEAGEVHALVFPCRRAAIGWINASTKSRVAVNPTHWRPWIDRAGGSVATVTEPAPTFGGG
jgi:hypothetical protein